MYQLKIVFGGLRLIALRLKIRQSETSPLWVGKNKILSLRVVNKTPIIRRKLNTMKGKIDKVPPSVNAIRVWLIRLGTGLIQGTGNERQRGDWALTTREAAKTSDHLSAA
jgi:hypothetical protein